MPPRRPARPSFPAAGPAAPWALAGHPADSTRITKGILQSKAHEVKTNKEYSAILAEIAAGAKGILHVLQREFDLEKSRLFPRTLHLPDHAAVKAGVTLPWSNGPVEGHINRLKMLKRQMFGRAHLDLLSRRFVLPPRRRPTQAARPREPAHPYAAAA